MAVDLGKYSMVNYLLPSVRNRVQILLVPMEMPGECDSPPVIPASGGRNGILRTSWLARPAIKQAPSVTERPCLNE